MRVSRAIERLRDVLRSRGLATTAAALSATLACHAVPPLPPGAAEAIAQLSLAALPTAAPALGASLIPTFAMSKSTTLIGSALLVGLSASLVVQIQGNRRAREETRQLLGLVHDLQQQQSQTESGLARLVTEAEQTRARWNELDALRTELARFRSSMAAASPAAAPQNRPNPKPKGTPPGREAQPPVTPLTEADIQEFLALAPMEQGRVLGAHRSPTGYLGPIADADAARLGQEYQKARELAGKIRPALEALEDRPAEFAEFQSSFIETVVRVKDADRLSTIRDVIRSTYEQAAADGLVGSARPQDGVEAWATRRDALDRQATRKVQGLLSEGERARFDRSFLGVMGIDLGLGDGKWLGARQSAGTRLEEKNAATQAGIWGRALP